MAAVFVAAGLSLVATRDAYATPSAKLVYVRGPDTAACPDEDQLRRAVATRIGYDPFFPSAPKTVIAQVSRAKAGYRGKVQITGDDGRIRGERELATRGDDCSELISAMALAVSIALDDLDEAPPTPPTPATATAPPAASDAVAAPASSLPAAPGEAITPPAPSPRAGAAGSAEQPAPPVGTRASRLDITASIGPVVSVGAAPGPSVGAAVAATVRYGWAAARLDLRADLPAGGDLAGGGRVSSRSVLATAALCARANTPFVCAGGGVGSFASTTSSISHPASDDALLVEALAVAGADVGLSRQVFLEPFVEVGFVLTRHRVFVDGVEAFRLPVVAGTGGIHLGWRFL